jgi:hypothetical protein
VVSDVYRFGSVLGSPEGYFLLSTDWLTQC